MAQMMQITLYGPNDEPIGTFTRSFVPWKLLKQAIRLSAKLGDGQNLNEEAIDDLAGLVVEVFGNRFTVEQLNEGADVGEMMTVLTAIVGKAAPANPTPPGG